MRHVVENEKYNLVQKNFEHNTINNYYKGVAHIDYVKKDTPPYYGVHETGSRSISYNDFFKVKQKS